MPGDSGVLVVTRVRSITTIVHETAGAAGTRHSPRPYWGREINANFGRIAPRECEAAFDLDVCERATFSAVIAREGGRSSIPGRKQCNRKAATCWILRWSLIIGLAEGETRWRSMTVFVRSDATLNSDSVIPGWRVSARPGISRFRVRCFASPRNDGSTISPVRYVFALLPAKLRARQLPNDIR